MWKQYLFLFQETRRGVGGHGFPGNLSSNCGKDIWKPEDRRARVWIDAQANKTSEDHTGKAISRFLPWDCNTSFKKSTLLSGRQTNIKRHLAELRVLPEFPMSAELETQRDKLDVIWVGYKFVWQNNQSKCVCDYSLEVLLRSGSHKDHNLVPAATLWIHLPDHEEIRRRN